MESFATHSRVIYLDLEYNNEVITSNKRPNPDHWKEVVQFGAVAFDHICHTEVGYYDVLVRPRIHVLYPDNAAARALERITGLSVSLINRVGVPFENAFQSFIDFCGDSPVVIMEGDADVIRGNFRLLNSTHATLDSLDDWFRIGPFLVDQFPSFAGVCSGELCSAIKVDIPKKGNGNLTVHNAQYDARSMAHFVDAVLQNPSLLNEFADTFP